MSRFPLAYSSGATLEIMLTALTAAMVLACHTSSTFATAGRARVEVDTAYYEVIGRTPREWARSMTANAQKAGVIPPFRAQTDWSTRFSYQRSTMTPRGCMASAPVVELQLRFRMPHLVTDSVSDSLALAEWARYDAALVQHEGGHAALAARAAAELADSLATIRAPTCALLATRLTEVNRDLRLHYVTLQKAYDEETAHGNRQGASLRLGPPPIRDGTVLRPPPPDTMGPPAPREHVAR